MDSKDWASGSLISDLGPWGELGQKKREYEDVIDGVPFMHLRQQSE